MSVLNKKNAAHLFIIPVALIACSVQASAIDFNTASDRQAYCQVYATKAVADARNSQSRGCGFTGASWSTDVNVHFDWCMSQTTITATTLENTNRANASMQCSGLAQTPALQQADTAGSQQATEFPPIVTDNQNPAAPAAASTAANTSFPPVVDTSAATPKSNPTMPPVVTSKARTHAPRTAANVNTFPAVRRGDAGDRLIEFGRHHRHEIRHVAHVLEEKLRDKFQEMKKHPKPVTQNFGGKLKNAFKSQFGGHVANR